MACLMGLASLNTIVVPRTKAMLKGARGMAMAYTRMEMARGTKGSGRMTACMVQEHWPSKWNSVHYNFKIGKKHGHGIEATTDGKGTKEWQDGHMHGSGTMTQQMDIRSGNVEMDKGVAMA